MNDFDRTRALRRVLGSMLLILVAIGVAVGSGADFTASSANPSNTFASGTLSMVNSKDGAAVLTASNMKPGDTASGTVDIENSGSLAGDFVLSRTDLVDSDGVNPLSAQLDLEVVDCGDFAGGTPTCDGGDPVEYSGTLGAMNSTIDLATYTAGEEHRYRFTVTFSSSAGDTYQGASSSATFQWDAS